VSAGITAARVAEFLGKGLLDVLVDLFKADPALYRLLGELVASPEMGVRLGASALVEELAAVDPGRRGLAAAALAPLLAATDPVRRGDAAWLLGFVGGAAERTALESLAARDPNADVREAAAEAAEKIGAMLTSFLPRTIVAELKYHEKGSAMEEKVKKALDQIRGSLQADGGDVEFVSVGADGVVKVRLVGACAGCPMSQMTLKQGIERYLKQQIPEVKEVVSV
jgi:Fe-S cluster biogenesis protein NfuA